MSAILVLLSTGGSITHAADLAKLTPDEHSGRALCGAHGFGEHIGSEPLRVHGPDDLNVTCRACRRSLVWKAATA